MASEAQPEGDEPADPGTTPTADSDGDAPPRRHVAMWVRIVVSVGLLVILVTKVPDFDGVLPARDARRTFSLLVAAALMTLAGVLLSAWRWQRVLAVYHVHVPFRVLTSHYLAGQFVSNVLPSTIGGDVLRVTRGAKSAGSSEIAFSSVVLERLTGFFALPFLIVVAFVVSPSLANHERAWLAIMIGGISLGLLGAILAAAASPRLAGRFSGHDNWMRFFGAVHVGVDRIRGEPFHLFAILGTAVLYQASVVISVVLIATALDLEVGVAALFMIVPVVAMVQVLPLSISGLGVREGMLVLFLVPLGVSSGQAVALGLLWFAALLGVSFLGAPAFAIGSRHRRDDEEQLDGDAATDSGSTEPETMGTDAPENAGPEPDPGSHETR